MKSSESSPNEGYGSLESVHMSDLDLVINFGQGSSVVYHSVDQLNLVNLSDKFKLPFPTITANVGAGGNCFYHSLAYLLQKSGIVSDPNFSFKECRKAMADYVDTIEKANEILMNVAEQWPETPNSPMIVKSQKATPATKRLANFAAEWNQTIGMDSERITHVKEIFLNQRIWGEANIVGVAENAFHINIACLAAFNKKLQIERPLSGKLYTLLINSKDNTASNQVPIWNSRTLILYNHDNYHWTPVMVPNPKTKAIMFSLSPEDMEKICSIINV